MPQAASVWRYNGAVHVRVAPVMCAMFCLDRVREAFQWPTALQTGTGAVLIYVPKLTDVRDYTDVGGTTQDRLEVPDGSGSFFEVARVHDQAKGHGNEFRVVLAEHIFVTAQARP
jgi:hypothetical protein